MALAGTSGADEFKLTPSIAVRQEYNDNIFFSSRDEVDDSITTVTPGLELLERTERLDLNLKAAVSPFYYWDNDDLDDVDHDYRGKASYRLSSLLRLRADAAYSISNRPDRDIDQTGLVQRVEERRRQVYGAGLDATLTEKAAMGLSYGFRRDRFPDQASDNEDWKANDVGLGFTYLLTPKTTGRLNGGYARYEYETSETDYYYGTVGVQYRLSEIFNFLVDGGLRYSDSDFDVARQVIVPPGVPAIVIETQNDSGWGGVGRLMLEYMGEKTRADVSASHDVDAASGRTGVVQRTRFVFNWRHRLLEKLRFGLFGGVYLNKSNADEFSSTEIDELVYNLRPTLRWEFYDNFTLEGAYQYIFVDNKANNNDAQRQVVFLQLAYGYPLFE